MYEFDPKKRAYKGDVTVFVVTLVATMIMLFLAAIGVWLVITTWR